MIKSVDDVIKALGGATAVADLVGVSVPAISNWSARGRISQDKFIIVSEALAELNEEASPEVFGFKMPEKVRE